MFSYIKDTIDMNNILITIDFSVANMSLVMLDVELLRHYMMEALKHLIFGPLI